MLDIVRNLVSSIFGKILLGIMVLSFALWGVGDILTSGNSQLAAKVGNEKITLDEFYNEFQKTVSLYNQQTSSSINLKEAKDLQLHNILLNDLIYSRMVKDYANKQKIFINDLDVIDLLPCLTTPPPHEATTNAEIVEQLKIFKLEPPVPQVSMKSLSESSMLST